MFLLYDMLSMLWVVITKEEKWLGKNGDEILPLPSTSCPILSSFTFSKKLQHIGSLAKNFEKLQKKHYKILEINDEEQVHFTKEKCRHQIR